MVLKIEVTKLKNSKVKNKTIAVLVSDNDGIRFAELLAEVSGMKVETYNCSEPIQIDSISSVIEKLNNDPDVILIINATRETVDIFIQKIKLCSNTINKIKNIKGEKDNLFNLKYKLQLLEVDSVIRRLNNL